MAGSTRRILTVFGTRPEAIKLAPVLRLCAAPETGLESIVCVTSQHKEMLVQVLELFGITPDYDLGVMEDDQDLFDLNSKIIIGMRGVLEDSRPHMVLVQGDTSTAFLAALAAYYKRVPVAHVEAGLRTGDKYNPFPEELNRTFISSITDIHFAPTERAKKNLLDEHVSLDNIFITGNTVIDALNITVEKVKHRAPADYPCLDGIDFAKRIVLVTGHRRENFGEGLRNICAALTALAENHDDIVIVYPVHFNPNVRKEVMKTLDSVPNIRLKEPMNYEEFVYLMNRSHLILTDSGGIQEEAPSLGKPVLVMRRATERPEAIEAGTAVLVGTDTANIVEQTERLLSDDKAYREMASAGNPYGDGTAAEKIVAALTKLTP